MDITPKTRRYNRINSLVMVVLILLLAAMLAWLSNRYPVVMDWTRSGRHTLSTASKEVLSKMTDTVEITAYAREDNDLREAIKNIVNRYQRVKLDIILRFVNPDAVPDEVRNLGININGEMVIRYQQRTQHVQSGNEEEFTNALQRLLHSSEHWLAFVEGHGERQPLGEANHDLGDWVKQLTSKGYKVQPVNLGVLQTVPENTRILIIAGPRVDFLPGELELIMQYLEQGGNLLWLADPGDLHGLERLSDLLPVQMEPGTIIDFAGRLIGVDDPTIALVTSSMFSPHPALKGFEYTSLFPEAGGLQTIEDDTWQARKLMETGDHTWLETGKLEGEVSYEEDSDIVGPITIGVSLERELGSEDNASTSRQQRIVIIRDGDFLSNTYLANGGNLDLGLRLVSWLSNEDDFITIPARSIEDINLELTRFTSILIGFGFLIILPLFFIGTGVTVWWRRRKS